MKIFNLNIMLKQKKAFTLIELLVVIAIIGILATLAVVALQQTRSRARDSKRVADMKQTQTALELFFNENGRYPTEEEWSSGAIESESSDNVFMYSIPFAPTPADGDCLEASNSYVYIPANDGSTYVINFCTGGQVSDLPGGAKQMTPGGIIIGSSGDNGGGDVEEDPFSGTSGTFVDIRDGQVYTWVKIGNQIWMAENLNTGIMIPNKIEGTLNYQANNGVIEKYCYDNLESNCDNYGGLYQWAETVQYVEGVSNDFGIYVGGGHVRGICPAGWHIPSDEEVKILEMYAGMSRDQVDLEGRRGTDEGAKLMSCRQVNSPYGGSCDTGNHPRWDFHENNHGWDIFSFSALPAGRVHSDEFIFADIGTRFVLRTSTPSSDTNSWLYNIFINALDPFPYQKIGRFSNPKNIAASIRCIKD